MESIKSYGNISNQNDTQKKKKEKKKDVWSKARCPDGMSCERVILF